MVFVSLEDVHIIDEHQFEAFGHRTHDKTILTNSNFKMRTLQHKLEVKGEFQKVIRNEMCGKPTKFVVAFGRNHSPLLKIQPNGSFPEPNDLAISEGRHNANTVK